MMPQQEMSAEEMMYYGGQIGLPKIKILGDPDFLMRDQASSLSEVYNKFYGSDGFTVSAHGGQVFIEVEIKESKDYKNSTGLQEINEDIEDIAFLIQRDLDRALLHKVKYLVKKTGIKNLCIAGGVGLNAVTNRFLLDHAGIDNILIDDTKKNIDDWVDSGGFGVYHKCWESSIKSIEFLL